MVYDLGASTIYARNENRSTTVSTDSDGNVRKEWGGENNNLIVDNTKQNDTTGDTTQNTTGDTTPKELTPAQQKAEQWKEWGYSDNLIQLALTKGVDLQDPATYDSELPPVYAQLGVPYSASIGYYTDEGVATDSTYRPSIDPTLDVIDAQTGEAKTSPEVQEVMDKTEYTKEQAIEFIKTGIPPVPVTGTAPVPTGVYKESDGYWYTSSGYKFNTKEEAELAEKLQLVPAPVISTDVLTDTPSGENKPGVLDNLKDTVTDLVSDVFGGTDTPSEENKPGVLDNLKDTVTDFVSDLFPVVSAGEQQPVLDQNLKEAADQVGTFELMPYPYDDKPGTLDKLSAWWDFATAGKDEKKEAATNLFQMYGMPDPYFAGPYSGRPAAQVVDVLPDKYESILKMFPVIGSIGDIDSHFTGISLYLTGLRDLTDRYDQRSVQAYSDFLHGDREIGDLGLLEKLSINRGAAIVNAQLNAPSLLEYVWGGDDGTIRFYGTDLSRADVEKSRIILFGDRADMIHESMDTVGRLPDGAIENKWLRAIFEEGPWNPGGTSRNILHPLTDVSEWAGGSLYAGAKSLYGKVKQGLDPTPTPAEKLVAGAGKAVLSNIFDLPGGVTAAYDTMHRYKEYAALSFMKDVLGQTHEGQVAPFASFSLSSAFYAGASKPMIDYAQESKIDEETVGAIGAELALAVFGDYALDAAKYGGKVGKLKLTTAAKNIEIDFRNRYMPLRTDADLLKDAHRRFGKDIDIDTAKQFYHKVDADDVRKVETIIEETPEYTIFGEQFVKDSTVNPNSTRPRSKHIHPEAKYEIPKIDSSYVEPEMMLQGSSAPGKTSEFFKDLFDDTPADVPRGTFESRYGVTDKGGEFIEQNWDRALELVDENTRFGKPQTRGEELVQKKIELRDDWAPGVWDDPLSRDGFRPYSELVKSGENAVTYATHTTADLFKKTDSAYFEIVSRRTSEVESLYNSPGFMGSSPFLRVGDNRNLFSLTKGKRAPNPTIYNIEIPTKQVIRLNDQVWFPGSAGVDDALMQHFKNIGFDTSKIAESTQPFRNAGKLTKKEAGQFKEFMEIRDRAVLDGIGSESITPKYGLTPPGAIIEMERVLAPGVLTVENPFVRNYTRVNGQFVNIREWKHVGVNTSAYAPAKKALKNAPNTPRNRPNNFGETPHNPVNPSKVSNMSDEALSQYTGPSLIYGSSLLRNAGIYALGATGRQRRGRARTGSTVSKNATGQNTIYPVYRSGSMSSPAYGVISSNATVFGDSSPITPYPGGSGGGGSSTPITPYPGGGGGGNSPITPVNPAGGPVLPLWSSRSLVAARRPRATPYPPYPGNDDDGPGKKKKKKKGVQPKQKKAKRTNVLIDPNTFFGFHLK